MVNLLDLMSEKNRIDYKSDTDFWKALGSLYLYKTPE